MLCQLFLLKVFFFFDLLFCDKKIVLFSIYSDTCFCAEVDLSGELRSVSNIDKRISEAERLGYKKIIISNNSKIGYITDSLQIHRLKNLSQVAKEVFREKD